MSDLQRSKENLPRPFRMKMPGRWSDGGLCDFRGCVRFTRQFGYPGRIDENERVWLTFAGLEGHGPVTLNDRALGQVDSAAGPTEYEITTILQPRNILCVDLESTKPSGGLWGEVAMEVRATAFLRDVQFQWESTNLVAHGLVVGEAARPLDLYLLAGQRFLTHQQVLPAPEGQSFEIVGDLGGMLKQKTVNARVELVDAATIWYVVRGIVERRQSNGCGDSSKE